MPYKDIEKKRACARNWARNHPEYRTRNRIAFRAAHPGYDSDWAKRHGFRSQKAYKARNKRKINGYTRARQARIFNTTVELVDYPTIVAAANGICQICYEPFGELCIEIDHIIPLSKGGTHTYNNLQATHGSCNRKKSDKVEPIHELGRR